MELKLDKQRCGACPRIAQNKKTAWRSISFKYPFQDGRSHMLSIGHYLIGITDESGQ